VTRFTIRYVASDGEKYQVVKDDYFTEIDLSDTSIKSVSLEPLNQCRKLEKIIFIQDYYLILKSCWKEIAGRKNNLIKNHVEHYSKRYCSVELL